MRVRLKGQGEVTLSKTDFIGGGGEGNVYAKGSTAFKIYNDPHKMIPPGKIQELSGITDPLVIKPERVVFDQRDAPIGYSMRFVKATHALCELFPPAFRTRHGISPQQTLDLVGSLQKRVRNIHSAGVLVVDLNEMNFLVDARFTEIYAIDVDSYQTPHYRASAIMASILDPRVQGNCFSVDSDWFSFAIVAFNLFVGIHPFKGKHPHIKGLTKRMAAGISVLNKEVRVPKVVLPSDVIPDVYQRWFHAIFEEGKRMAPPGDLRGGVIITPVVRSVARTDKLDIRKLYVLSGVVRGFWDQHGTTLVWTDDGLYLGDRWIHGDVSGVCAVGFTPKYNKPIVAGTSDGMLRLFDSTTQTELPVALRADAVMSHGGRLYVRNRNTIVEILFNEMGPRLLVASRIAGNCLEHATRLFDGVVVQSLLGATWVSLFPDAGIVYQMHLAELDGYRVVDARYDNAVGPKAKTGVLMVTRTKEGKYDRLVFRFSEGFEGYDVRIVADVIPDGLNFVVLDTGVCLCMTQDETLELFSCRKGSTGMKVVDDPILGADLQLGKQGGEVVFFKGNRVFTMGLN